MKKNMIIILIFNCVLFAACLEDKRQIAPEKQAEIVDTVKTEKKDTTKQTADTSKVVKENVDTTLTTLKPEEPMQAYVVEKANYGISLWGIISLTLGVGSLLLAIILWYRTSLMYKNVCYDLKHLEHEDERNMAGINKRLTDSRKEIADALQKLQVRQDELAKEVDAMRRNENNNHPNSQFGLSSKTTLSKNEGKVKPKLKTGYFGVVKTGNGLAMFNDYPKSRNEDAYFEMTYLDDTHCEFAPFDLDRIRAIDDITSAVNYTGSMAYAKEMKVLASGKAEYNNERNFWKITDRATIELL